MKNKIKVLSIFDGIGGCRQALKELNIDCEYYASEIDPYAIKVAKANHPDIIEIGDAKGLAVEDGYIFHNQNNDPMKNGGSFKADIDLLVAGFPCQSFSIAGNQKGFEDERGQLFFNLLEILNKVKPKYFLFENVFSMGKANKDIIDEKLGIKHICINSSLLTAQQRKRIYWIGKLVGDKYEQVMVEQPKDAGIFLKDIIDDEADEKLFIKEIILATFTKKGAIKGLRSLDEKSLCLNASLHKGFGNDSCTVIRSPIRIGHFNKGAKTGIYEIGGGIRKLSVNECEKLQGFPDYKKKLIFCFNKDTINDLNQSIFLCVNSLENQKKNANAEDQNHKLLKPALNAQKNNELKEVVRFARKYIPTENIQTKKLALKSVHINLGESIQVKHNQGKFTLNAKDATNKNLSVLLMLIENFVQHLATINTAQEKTVQIGKEETLQSISCLLTHKNGKKPAIKFGLEIEEFVKDVIRSLNQKNTKHFIATTLAAGLNLNNYEQQYTILLFFVLIAINLFTQEKILIENSLEIRLNSNYCSSVSPTQGYKCLGNSFTVPIIKHILQTLKKPTHLTFQNAEVEKSYWLSSIAKELQDKAKT